MNPKRPFAQAGFRTIDGKVWPSGPFHDVGVLPDDFELESEGFVGHDGSYYTRAEATAMLQAANPVQSENLAFANPEGKVKTHQSPLQGGAPVAKAEAVPFDRRVRRWMVDRKIYRAKSLKKGEGAESKAPPSFLAALRAVEIYLKSMDSRPEFAAARTLSGKHAVPYRMHEALGMYDDPHKQALHAHGLEAHDENVAKLKALVGSDINKLAKRLPEDPAKHQPTNNPAGRKSDFVVTHNLTVDNLKHADELGGLAAPSLAVAHRDHPLDGFGDVTLVAHPDMIDPQKGTPVFDADIYSPRHPQALHKIDEKKLKALRTELEPHAKATGGNISDLGDKIESGDMRHDNDYPAHWRAFASAFLASKGVKLEHPSEPVAGRYSEFAEQPEMQAFKKKYSPAWGEYNSNYHNSAPRETLANEGAKKEFQDAIFAAAKHLDAPHKGTEFENLHTEGLHSVMDEGELPWHVQSQMVDALHQHGHTRPSVEGTREQLRTEIAKHPDFKDWYDSKIKGVQAGSYIPNGFTPSGNRRRIPYTLDNVLKMVTKKTRGGEGFNYGVGTIRSSAARQFNSLDEIRAHGHRLVSKEEMKKVKEANDEEFGQIASLLQRHHSKGSDFGFLDTVSRSLTEAAKKGRSIQGELAKDGFQNVPPDVVNRIKKFLSGLRDAPTEYFEAKPQRAVQVREFKGAAVPHTTDPAFIENLKGRGLHVETYDKDDQASRAQAIQRITDAQKLHLSEADLWEAIHKSEFISSHWLSKGELEIPGLMPQTVKPVTQDAIHVAESIQKACQAGLCYDVVLDGKHSHGAKLVFDDKAHQFWLLKPGSGPQSRAAGLHETVGSQAQREACFSQIARKVFDVPQFPIAALIEIDGTKVAAVMMAPANYVAAQDLGQVVVQQDLREFLETGDVHKWALIDYILGNTDSHGHNMLMEPDDKKVSLIDHGGAFAGRSFAPGHDPATFVPYYLRVWNPLDFHTATPEQRAAAMPAPQPGLDKELAHWLRGIRPEAVAVAMEENGIDDAGAAVSRLVVLQDSETPGADVVRLWAGFQS